MFDVGFWELVVIGVVALIVIGPERLPAVARTVGVWVGRARRFVGTVQEDISREINKGDELKRLLQEQTHIKEMHEIIEQTVDETRKTVAIGKKADAEHVVDTGERLSAHQPRSLDGEIQAPESSPKQPATAGHATSGATADQQVSASATDAMNDSAK